ncbi:DUF5666 domain-containing protein [Patescibacteria group bacterium]|nr:DUF5666 domain-containing protein [Patescibacteria group bacterium]
MTSNMAKVILGILILVLVGGVAFTVGRRWTLVRNLAANRGISTPNNPFYPNNFRRGVGPGMMYRGYGNGGSGGISGQITNLNGSQMTLTLPSGQTYTVNVNTNTTYSQVSPAAQGSLRNGENVTVFLSRGADGSTSAQSVRINSATQ